MVEVRDLPRSSRDARYRGRSRTSTVPYEVFARRALSWQVSCLDRALREMPTGWQRRFCTAQEQWHTSPCEVLVGGTFLRDRRFCGRSRSSTVPYVVLARRSPLWQVSFLDRALRGPCATLAFVAGLVPRPCPTWSSRDARHCGRSRSSTVPYEVLARRAALRQVSCLDRALRGPRAPLRQVSCLGPVASQAPWGDRSCSPKA